MGFYLNSKANIMILITFLLLSKLTYGSDECSICFEAMSDEERVSLGCHNKHDVHRGCAKRWFGSQRERSAQATCPSCRAVVDLSIVSDVSDIPVQNLEAAQTGPNPHTSSGSAHWLPSSGSAQPA